MTARTMSIGMIAAAILAGSAFAQPAPAPAPAPPSATPAPPSAPHGGETVNLTMEQRHIIKEIIVKDMKSPGPGQDQAARVPAQVGATVPAGIPIQPMPVEVAAKVPQIKTHSFLVKDDKVLIIDSKDNKIAALIE